MRQKFNAKQLRYKKPTKDQLKKLKRQPIYIILDNILDTYNIGAIFRLADAIAVAEVIVCGRSETPPNLKIHRAAIGTEGWVPWRYQKSAAGAINQLRKEFPGLKVFAVEQSKKSIDYRKVNYSFPLAFVLGNETYGVSDEVLDLADQVIEIPMWGFNASLNVMVSLAVILWKVMEDE